MASSIAPKKIRVEATNKILDRTIKKYGNIEILNKDIVEARRGIPTVYIGNHLSNIDGVLLNNLLKDNDIAFMAGVKLSKNPLTKLVMDTVNTIPIEPNSPDKKALKKAVEHLSKGGSLFIFPEGTRSRTGAMIESRKGFLLIAKMANVDIVPIGLEGTEKLLPIKGDMGRESFQYADVKIIVGKPFSILEKTEANKDDWTNIANRNAMGKIAELIDNKYRGVYK